METAIATSGDITRYLDTSQQRLEFNPEAMDSVYDKVGGKRLPDDARLVLVGAVDSVSARQSGYAESSRLYDENGERTIQGAEDLVIEVGEISEQAFLAGVANKLAAIKHEYNKRRRALIARATITPALPLLIAGAATQGTLSDRLTWAGVGLFVASGLTGAWTSQWQREDPGPKQPKIDGLSSPIKLVPLS
ncbi:MAG TPA: hypothetical protein VMR45_01785 [Patescibacteria group bacterium]|nr:hypothetical protein [Patescibacteria group bacterium]